MNVSADPRELVATLFDRPDRDEWTDADAATKLSIAVEAVLDLHHEAIEAVLDLGGEWTPSADEPYCGHCGNIHRWPCPTVQVIISALGEQP